MTAVAVIADYWGWHHGDMGFGWWLVMFFINVIFWAAVIYGIVWLVRNWSATRHLHTGLTPQEILDRRLAAGEISADEYERLRSRLSGTPPTASGDEPAAST